MVTPKLENTIFEYDGNIVEYQDDWNENNSDELLEKSIENLSDIAERASNPEENSLEYENFIADDSTMEIRDESLSLECLEVQQKKNKCDYCEKSFTQSNNLKLHIRNAHEFILNEKGNSE